jgi:putative transposase
MARGFVYLMAVLDWANHNILSYRVAITLETVHAVEALEEMKHTSLCCQP